VESEGVIFVGTPNKICAVSASARKILWQKTLDGQLTAGPLLWGKQLYYTTSNLKVFKIQPTGKTMWQVSLPRNPTNALLTTDKYVFVGDHKGQLYCLSPKKGKILWKKDTGAGSIAPVLLCAGDTIFVANTARKFLALSASRGKQIWEYEAEKNFSCPPILRDGILFIGDEKGGLFAYDARHIVGSF
jgi:outer membrane protein assembly factor BamB